MIGADNITRRSEGPLAGCATATAKTFGSRSLAGRWGRSPTQVALGNAAGRLPRGKPDEGEPHVRFGKGEQETGFAPRLLPTSPLRPSKSPGSLAGPSRRTQVLRQGTPRRPKGCLVGPAHCWWRSTAGRIRRGGSGPGRAG